MVNGISHSKVSGVPNAAGNLVGGADFDAAHQILGYLDIPEGSEPASPSAGSVRFWADSSDKSLKSKDSTGVVRGPFDEGGAAAPFDADGTTDLYGLDSLAASADILDDKFEYSDWAAFTAVWTPRNLATDKILIIPGAGVFWNPGGTAGYGIELTTLGTGSLDVILALQAMRAVNSSDMLGIHQVDSSGNGSGFTENYDGNSYAWGITARQYAGTGANFGAAPTNKRADGRRFCLGMKRNGTSVTFYTRNASTGTWTTIGSDTRTAQARLFLGTVHPSNGTSPFLFSRVMIGSLGNLL